jgi:acyl phosphate:glycerol-3-phosphate acyltransferase
MTPILAIVTSLSLTLLAYLIGSISPSILLAKSRGVDIKKEGSGNAGTTNTLRVMGPTAAVITLVIDICKGFFAVYLGAYLFNVFLGAYLVPGAAEFYTNQTIYLCAGGVVFGHIFPVFFKFKGGKGVATAFGTILAVNWTIALILLAIAAVGVAVSRRMSVGSLLGAVALPFLCVYYEFNFLMGAVFLTFLIIYTHRENLIRLRTKTEPKISFGSKGK